MTDIRKGLFYAAYGVAALIFFLYYLFPADTVKTYISDLAGGLLEAHPGFGLGIDRVAPTFPPGLRLSEVKLDFAGRNVLSVEQVKLSPAPASFFKAGTGFGFDGRLYSGTLEGAAEFTGKASGGAIEIEGRLAGIQVEQMTFIPEMTGRKISGRLGGSFRYAQGTEAPPGLRAQLSLSNGAISLLLPLPGMSEFGFESIDAGIVLNRGKLVVSRCVVKGLQLDGTFSGNVILRHPVGESAIRFSGTVRPHPRLMAELKGLFPESGNGSRKNGYFVTFGGTLGNPNFKLK